MKVFFFIFALTLTLLSPSQKYSIVLDHTKIRHGDLTLFDEKRNDKIGTVRSPEVYESIEAYKTIRSERVAEGSARWQQLMMQATEAYKGSLRAIATNGSYVLIVEEGGVSNYQTKDITSEAVKEIK